MQHPNPHTFAISYCVCYSDRYATSQEFDRESSIWKSKSPSTRHVKGVPILGFRAAAARRVTVRKESEVVAHRASSRRDIEGIIQNAGITIATKAPFLSRSETPKAAFEAQKVRSAKGSSSTKARGRAELKRVQCRERRYHSQKGGVFW